jgi:hypothetical protein
MILETWIEMEWNQKVTTNLKTSTKRMEISIQVQIQVEKFFNKDNDKDSEDGPPWMFKEGETLSRDSEYVFCPAPP